MNLKVEDITFTNSHVIESPPKFATKLQIPGDSRHQETADGPGMTADQSAVPAGQIVPVPFTTDRLRTETVKIISVPDWQNTGVLSNQDDDGTMKQENSSDQNIESRVSTEIEAVKTEVEDAESGITPAAQESVADSFSLSQSAAAGSLMEEISAAAEISPKLPTASQSLDTTIHIPAADEETPPPAEEQDDSLEEAELIAELLVELQRSKQRLEDMSQTNSALHSQIKTLEVSQLEKERQFNLLCYWIRSISVSDRFPHHSRPFITNSYLRLLYAIPIFFKFPRSIFTLR